MKPGNGKIANLPSSIQDQLNYRISEGEQGIALVEWLNSNPEVAEVVNKLFDGIPISEQNLSEWRKRGYQKWLAHHNAVDESNAAHDNSADIAATGIDPDKLLLTLTGAYAEMTRNWMITPGADMLYKLAVYKKLTDGVIALQRAELQKIRMEIARERLELLREKRLSKSASCSRPSSETAPESTPASNQNDSECRSRDCGIIEPFRQAQGPELAEGLRHSSASAEADAPRQETPATEEPTPKLQSPALPEAPPSPQKIPRPVIPQTGPYSQAYQAKRAAEACRIFSDPYA